MKISKISPSLCRSRGLVRALGAVLVVLLSGIACTRDPAVRKQKFLQSGNRYYAEKRFDEAVIQYRNAIQVDAHFAEGYFRLGLCLLQVGDLIGAGQSFTRAVEFDSDNLDARLRLGNLLLGTGQFDDAVAQAQEVLSRNPKNADAHILLGQVHQQRKEFGEAKREFELAMPLAPGDPAPYTDLALAQLLNREFGDAEKNFQKALELKSNEPQLVINLANFYRSLNKQDRAEQVLKSGAAAAPRAVAIPLSLADLYATEGRAAESKNLLDQLESRESDFPEGRRSVADFYFSHREIPPALDRYLRLAGNSAQDQALLKRIAECYLSLGRWQDAEAWLARQNKKKKDPEFRLLHGRALLGQLRLGEALAEFQALTKEVPAMIPAHYYLAQVYLQKGDFRAAKDAFTDTLRQQPGYLPAFLGLADLALLENDTQVALQYGNQIISQTYWVAEGHLVAGNAHFQRGELAAALKEFDVAAGLEPQSAEAQERRGRVLTALKKYADAEKAFEAALQAAPRSAPALGGLTNNFLAQGQVDRARTRIAQQAQRQPESYEIQLVMGEFCMSRKDWTCAEQGFRRAVELYPYAWIAYAQLARIYKSTNRLAEAVQTYEKARQQFPDILADYITLAMAYEAQGDVSRAQQVYQDALKVDPNFVPAQNNLAWLYLQHGGPLDEALKLAQRARTQKPDDPHITDTLAWAYYKKGWYPSAIELLEPTVAKNPKSSAYQFHLGMTYVAGGKPDLGRKALQASLRLGLSGEGARLAQETLAKLVD